MGNVTPIFGRELMERFVEPRWFWVSETLGNELPYSEPRALLFFHGRTEVSERKLRAWPVEIFNGRDRRILRVRTVIETEPIDGWGWQVMLEFERYLPGRVFDRAMLRFGWQERYRTFLLKPLRDRAIDHARGRLRANLSAQAANVIPLPR